MANLSATRRNRMFQFLEQIKKNTNEKGVRAANEVEAFITANRYGLIWEEHEEAVDLQIENSIPVFIEDEKKKIIHDSSKKINFLLEGDNLHSLYLLEKTHGGRIDLILIDPPYNRGKDDFRYDDKIVDGEDAFKHSKWLSFMSRRLLQARKLLSDTGIIAVNIDEHEVAPLIILMEEIFGDENNLGTIIWNKKNPKGDAHKISTMHEYILIFAKDYKNIKGLEGFATRKKPNAKAILAKAKQLYSLLGKKCIPTEMKTLAKLYDYPEEKIKDLTVEYDLDLINREFANWLNKQAFSAGEKAYKYIDENGRVYRGVSMAWPNKKKAPEDYFTPLIHPITGKPTPVPARGWRNPPSTMERLLKEGRILFGKDEKKQAERKYFLDENMTENTPSIYNNADSADRYMEKIGISFEYPKPVSEVKYLIQNLHPNPKIVLDFFAGSATTGHAVMEVNQENRREIHFILCTNNQDGIAENTAYKRLKIEAAIYGTNLKYYKTGFIPRKTATRKDVSKDLQDYISEMLELDFGIDFQTSEEYCFVLTEKELDSLLSKEEISNRIVFAPASICQNRIYRSISEEKSLELSCIPAYFSENEFKEKEVF